MSLQTILESLKRTQKCLTPAAVQTFLGEIPKGVLIDVREREEWSLGHIPGAVFLSRGFLELKVESQVPEKTTPIVVYCASGTRSLFAAATLTQMGYSQVYSLEGGFSAWKAAGLPFESCALSAVDRERYARQIAIPQVGEAGQARLLSARVLFVGVGGLASPAAFYLAAAGVGTIGLVDADQVEESNLQRQILHTTSRVGTLKVESARKTLSDFNPRVKIKAFPERLTSGNIDRLFADFDVIVDASDNFPTRYLINDACVRMRKPCVHGSVFRFDGQVAVFDTRSGGPCYCCLYPEPPPPELAPSCAEAGVLGVLPGMIGMLQAVETLKLILKVGNLLSGRLLTFEALSASFKEYCFKRDPSCPTCGEKRATGYADSEYHCRVAQ